MEKQVWSSTINATCFQVRLQCSNLIRLVEESAIHSIHEVIIWIYKNRNEFCFLLNCNCNLMLCFFHSLKCCINILKNCTWFPNILRKKQHTFLSLKQSAIIKGEEFQNKECHSFVLGFKKNWAKNLLNIAASLSPGHWIVKFCVWPNISLAAFKEPYQESKKIW